MEYCVLVKISKKTIEFFYQIDGGNVEFLALSDREQEIPLAFYLNGDEFIMGEYAMERVKMNDSNAFFPYFDLIREPGKFFTFSGVQRPIKQLLYLGVERYLSEFLRNKLILQDSSIDSNRASIPLRLCFNRDVTVPEKQIVLDIFRESGYGNVNIVETDMTIFDTLSSNNKCKLFLTGLNGDLYMNFFKSKTDKCESSKMLEGIGSDPRYRICADLLFNEITESNPYFFIDKESNFESFLKEAGKIFESTLPIVMGSIRLLSGESCDYSINKAILDDRLKQMSASLTLLSETDYFLRTLSVEPNDVDIILDGGVNTDFFVEKLHEKYPCVYQMTDTHRRKILKEIFDGLDLTPPVVVIPKSPENKKNTATSTGISEPLGDRTASTSKEPIGISPIGDKVLRKLNEKIRIPNPFGTENESTHSEAPSHIPGWNMGGGEKTQTGNTPPPSPKPEKSSINQYVGGLINAGKKTISGMSGKIKSLGLKDGMMAGVKGIFGNLSNEIIVVGRNGEQKMAITQTSVELAHCTLRPLRNGKVEVEDLSSSTGTFINDVSITNAVVNLDDVIRLGPTFKAKVRDLLVVK